MTAAIPSTWPRQLAVAIVVGGATGLLAAAIFDTGLLDGLVNGIAIGTPLIAFERGILFPRLRALVRRSATPVYFAAVIAAFLAASVVGHLVAGLILWTIARLTGLRPGPLAAATAFEPWKMLYGFLMMGLVTVGFRMIDLIGPNMLASLVLGRYHRPVSEERLFLFLDLAGSTAFAERHGDLRAQELLGRVFETLAEPVRDFHGSIDDYIGDMAIVTWPLERGVRDATAILCLFAFLDEIERDAAEWRRRFGEVPRFRAALHGGRVVTAEIGLDHHKITYFGDVVNTTSRLEALSKTVGEDVVVSADLLEKLRPLPTGIVAADLGLHALKGRDETMAVAGLRREASDSV